MCERGVQGMAGYQKNISSESISILSMAGNPFLGGG